MELFFGYSAHRSLIDGASQFRSQFVTSEGGLTDYGLAKLLLAAYENKCMNENKPPKYVFDDMMEYVDTASTTDEGKAEMAKALEEWAASSHTKKMIEEAKKKGLMPEDITSTSTTSSEPATEGSASDPGNSPE